MDQATTTALIDEAVKRAGLVWVKAAGSAEPARPLWHLWEDGVAYLLTGGAEQPMPAGLDSPDARAEVTVASKDNGSRLVTFPASVEVIPSGTPAWDAITPKLQAKRLNAGDGEAAPQRWARECVLLALRPDGAALETPDSPSTGSHAAAPPTTVATTAVPRPWHLFGRQGRAVRRQGGRDRRSV